MSLFVCTQNKPISLTHTYTRTHTHTHNNIHPCAKSCVNVTHKHTHIHIRIHTHIVISVLESISLFLCAGIIVSLKSFLLSNHSLNRIISWPWKHIHIYICIDICTYRYIYIYIYKHIPSHENTSVSNIPTQSRDRVLKRSRADPRPVEDSSTISEICGRCSESQRYWASQRYVDMQPVICQPSPIPESWKTSLSTPRD